MEFLVGFDVTIPDGTPESEVKERMAAETTAAVGLARQGHLVRVWRSPVAPGESKAIGLYRADSKAELDGLLGALPLNGWMQLTVTPLESHPNDPASPRPSSFQLPDPRLTPVYHLEATLGEPVDLGNTDHGHRRIVPLTEGTFAGPTINGKLLPGASADWQTVLLDGTAIGDIRYTLQQNAAMCCMSSHGVSGTAAPKFWPGWLEARRSMRASTHSASPPRSRRPPLSSIG
jgi:muconolactone D-isomerase